MRRAVRSICAATGVATVLAALSGGVSQAAQSTFATSNGAVKIEPAAGSVVGIAYPVTVTFATSVGDRAAAEDSIHISSSTDVPGHFSWADERTVQWIPDEYWAPHSTIDVEVHGLSTGFETGDAVMAVADISDHTFTVSVNGEVLRVMAASMGKPKRPTPVGSFTALTKERTIKFDSRTIGIPLNDPEGYLLDGQYAVRVTWSGVYVHSAPWSVGSQGYANVSHGCINLSQDNAAWYFDTVHIGDPIIVQA